MSSFIHENFNETVINITETNQNPGLINYDQPVQEENVLFTIKIIALIVITSVTLIFGYLPLIW
jgi:hypothetical protein